MQAFVLSGGGSKGAYQVGVWQALKKLHKRIDIVTGTSIGALNGVMITQKTYYKCINLWENIGFTQLFDGDFSNIESKKDAYLKYAKEFIKNGGMDTNKLEKYINDAIEIKKFYKSKIKFGLVTYNLSEKKAEEKIKDEIPPNKLKEYVLASATCFPAFKIKNIDEEKYIDGGYYDNLPINLAIKMGATNIIAVDLNCIGFKQKINNPNIPIKIIEPKNDLGSFLIFDKNQAKKNIKYGYNDTLKSFNKLDGNFYTFKKNHLYQNYKKYKWKFSNLLKEIFQSDQENKNIYDNFIKYTIFKKLILNQADLRINMNETIEYLGKIYKLDDTKIYNIKKYNKLLIINNDELKVNEESLINLKIDDAKDVINSKLLVKYIYNKLTADNYTFEVRKELCRLASMFQNDFMGAMYLLIINNEY